MESFGAILRKKREEKNRTIETVARETIILRQYIEALENENIDAFPSHTYIMGFLRNYSDYLGLDASYMIKLFQGKVIQEAPPPENLIRHRRLSKKKILAIILSSVVGLCLVAFFCVYFFILRPQTEINSVVDLKNGQGQEYVLSAIPFQQRLYKDDILKFLIDGETIDVLVSDTLNALALQTPIGLQFVELGEELEIDIDGKNGSDIVVFLSDISHTDGSLGAEVRMFLKAGSDATGAESSIVTAGSISLESDTPLIIGAKQTVILEDNRAYPFTINASFRGPCLYRYKSDRSETNENFFASGNTLVMQAQNGLRLWMSNANSVKMEVIAGGITYPLEMGRPGQVLVQDVRWIRNADNVYKLVVIEID